MHYLRFVAPTVAALFSLYAIIWGLVAQNYSTTYHVDAILFGLGLALIAFLRLRFSLNSQPLHNWRDQKHTGE